MAVERKQSVAVKVGFRLFDSSTGAPKTGATWDTCTAKLCKQGGSAATKTLVSGDITELDATALPGTYTLLLSSSDMNTPGELICGVAHSGADTEVFSIEVVAMTAQDLQDNADAAYTIDPTTKTQIAFIPGSSVTARKTWALKGSDGTTAVSTPGSIYNRGVPT